MKKVFMSLALVASMALVSCGSGDAKNDSAADTAAKTEAPAENTEAPAENTEVAPTTDSANAEVAPVAETTAE